MESIAPAAHAADPRAQAVGFQVGVGVALGIQHADLVVTGEQIPRWTDLEVALLGLAPAEQHRLALLGLRLRLLPHDPGDHRLDPGVSPQKDFLSAPLKAERFFEVNRAAVQLS